MWLLIVITLSVVRAENYVRSLPDRLSPGGVVRSGYKANYNRARLSTSRRVLLLSVFYILPCPDNKNTHTDYTKPQE